MFFLCTAPEIVVVCQNSKDRWHQALLTTLKESFKLEVKELFLPENTNILNDFESELHHKLKSEHCQYFFIFQTVGDSQSPYSCVLSKVISSLEARPCHYFEKVWVILVGAQTQAVIQSSTITRLCVTQAPGKDESSGKECALRIYEEVSKRGHSCRTNGETQGLGSASLDPNTFRDLSNSKESKVTASWPLPKKGVPPQEDYMNRMVDVQERTAVAIEMVAEAAQSMAKSAKQTSETTRRTETEVGQIHNIVENVQAIVEDDGR